MPTYDYQCTSCQHEWEAEQSIKAEPLKDCPKCGASGSARRLIGRTGFVLNGSGWARDGYKS